MKKNKRVVRNFSAALLALSLGLSSCTFTRTPTKEEEEDGLKRIYNLYVASGGELTYEEWLASIKGEPGAPGADGVGIVSIKFTDSDGVVDTYTITYSDGTTSTFTVTNGADGIQGIQGEPGQDGHTPVVTIGENGHWFVDGVDSGFSAQGPQGEPGKDGTSVITGYGAPTINQGKNGDSYINLDNWDYYIRINDVWVKQGNLKGEAGRSVVSIELTSSVDQYDTYTITYSDGTTSHFVVTNGQDGAQGIQGVPGADGRTPSVTIGENGHWFIDGVDTGVSAKGQQGDPGAPGADGVGILFIEKTSSDGLMDTYTITYSDGHTSTFIVTNGAQGEQGIQGQPGEDGHTPVIKIGENGHWFIDGIDTGFSAQGPQGQSGKDGVSIISIEKTNTVGLIDTYTITYSDGTTSVFTVTNGANGQDGAQGIQGVPGADGHTPVITISSEGYWVIDGEVTSFYAQGPKGDNGVSIVSIVKTSTEGLVDTYTITYSNGTTSTFTVTNGEEGAQGPQGEQGIQGQPGEDGHTPVIVIGDNGHWFVDNVDTGIAAQGPQGVPGEQGAQGVGISAIRLTATNGNIDTYTIYYTDGTTSIFTVTNGQNGAQGEQGIQGQPGADGHTPEITIGDNGHWFVDGSDTGFFAQGPKGDQGDPGRGITSIVKTSSEGLVDVYTITYTDGTTSTFVVTNGAQGEQGEQGIQGIQGQPGQDGHTPVITIGDNGHWFIDGNDTGFSAKGEQGEQGPQGQPGKDGVSVLSIAKTGTNGLVDTYTITYSDGTTSIFTVTNGTQGIQGIQGEPGADGHTPVITISNDGYWTVDGVKTEVLAQGPKGEDGVSVTSIIKTSSEGLEDTYTITYSDGHTSTFVVTNGQDGAQGIQGIQGEPGEDGHTPVIIISQDGHWYVDSIDTGISAQGPKGDQGEPGVSITSVIKTGSDGLVDTYAIIYSDGHTSTFTVTNGAQGEQGIQGIQGIQGVPGEDGHSPEVTIGNNGHWFVDGVDTGTSAQGPVGEDGVSIESVVKTGTDGLVDTYTITYSNGSTSTFTVTNGTQGEQGPQGDPGKSAYEIYCEAHPEYQGDEAQWLDDLINGRLGTKETHTVTFDTQGGSEIDSQIVEHGDLATRPDDPTKAGYTFLYWTIEEDSDFNWLYSVYTVNDDITLIAVWSQDEYTITYENDDGSILEVHEGLHYGDDVSYEGSTPVTTMTDAPEHYIYVFSGWDVNVSTATCSLTITATYSLSYVPYTVTFIDYNGDIISSRSVQEGTSSGYQGDTPTRQSADGLQYNFAGWVLEVSEENLIVYRATYESCMEGLVFSQNKVTGYTGTATDVVIPSSWNGYAITEIDSYAFNEKSIISITIPDSITKLGAYTFRNCTNLTTVNLPSTLQTVDFGTFYGCTSLVSVVLPNSLLALGGGDFYGCTSLVSVVLPSGLTEIKSYVFRDCSNLLSVNIPSSVTKIGIQAFMYCSSLTSVTIPESVLIIESGAFEHCTHLQSVVLPSGITVIESYTFYGCMRLTSVVLPSGLTEIKSNAFYNTSYVDSSCLIVIPSSVTTIGYQAFGGCSYTTLYFESETEPENLDPNWGQDFVKLIAWGYKETVKINGYSYAIGRKDEEDLAYFVDIDDSVTDFELPSTINGKRVITTEGIIKSCVFGNNNLTRIVLPECVKTITRFAFYGCTSLTYIALTNVEKIEVAAFSGCSNLKMVVISDTLITIESDYGQFMSARVILCEGTSQPEGWASNWCRSDAVIVWGYNGEQTTSNGYSYAFATLNNETVAYLIGIDDSVTDFELPSTINGKRVIATNEALLLCLNHNENIQTAVIPEDVTTIVAGLFSGCTSLVTVSMSDNVLRIESEAFSGCTSLENITLSNELVTISWNAFVRCTSLVSITIPNSVTSIESNVFYECSALESIVLSNSLQSIGSYAFAKCTALTSITIPNSVTNLDASVFHQCTSLATVILSNNLVSIGRTAFNGCTALTSITIPDSVTILDDYIFNSCSSLETVVLSNNITSISAGMFNQCTALTSITIPNSVVSIQDRAFYLCYNLSSVVFSNNLESIGEEAFLSCSKIESLNLPNSLVSIGARAFQSGGKYETVIIPNSVTSIGSGAFSGLGQLRSITFPNSITEIPNSVASGCWFLETVILGNNVISIGEGAFSNNGNLRNIVLPNTVETIGTSAFSNCTGLETIIIPESVTSIGENAFSGCSRLVVFIPSSVLTIGGGAFNSALNIYCSFESEPQGWSALWTNCQNIHWGYVGTWSVNGYIYQFFDVGGVKTAYLCDIEDSVVDFALPETVDGYTVLFDDDSYQACIYRNNNLQTVVIPNGVTSIGNNDFTGCTSLVSIVIPSTVLSIGFTAFSGCTSLNTVYFEDGSQLETISSYAFNECTALTTINLPHTVTSIGSGAFHGCESLLRIVIPITTLQIGSDAFYGCQSLIIYCEASSKPAGWNDDLTSPLRVIWGVSSNYVPICVNGVEYMIVGENELSIIKYYGTNQDTLFIYGELSFGGVNYNVVSIESKSFNTTSLKAVFILGGVRIIKSEAFLQSVPFCYISSCVTEVESNGFDTNSYTSYPAIYYCEASSKPDGWANNYAGNAYFVWDVALDSVFVEGDYVYHIIDDLKVEITKYTGTETEAIVPESVTHNNVTYQVVQIGSRAFSSRDINTKSIVIPDSVTTICDYAFSNRHYLESVTLGRGIEEIGSYAFFCCRCLTSITFLGNVHTIGDGAFYYCDSLVSITLPDTLQVIGAHAFERCSALESIIIPDSVISIGASAFTNCDSLVSIDLSNTSAVLSEAVFSYCTSLETVVLPVGLTSIANFMFSGCSSLSTIVIPETVQELGAGVFTDCTSLTSITIPVSVRIIHGNIFNGCTSLSEIIFTGTIAQWNSIVKYGDVTGGTTVDRIQCSDGDVNKN